MHLKDQRVAFINSPIKTIKALIDFSKPKVLAALVADFRYLKRHFFQHPRYLKVSGRPMKGDRALSC